MGVDLLGDVALMGGRVFQAGIATDVENRASAAFLRDVTFDHRYINAPPDVSAVGRLIGADHESTVDC